MAPKNSKRKSKPHQEAPPAQATQEQTHQQTESAPVDTGSQEAKAEESIRLDFPYSDLVRAYAPKAMDVADKAADDWKKEGSFMNLGIENPYANMAVSMGLQKAKELEKKLEEKGVLSAVRMGFEVIKNKVYKKE